MTESGGSFPASPFDALALTGAELHAGCGSTTLRKALPLKQEDQKRGLCEVKNVGKILFEPSLFSSPGPGSQE